MTHTRKEPGSCTYTMMAVLCCFTGPLGCCCCWIPMLVDHWKDTVHTCPQCNRVVGVWPAS
ncbi:cell death-inducing p53-target protein 1-like [Haemaphysalis longicornis]